MLRKKRYFAVALLLVVVIWLTIGSVSRLVQQRSSAPSPYVALFRPDAPDCATLFWHGIRVGETKFEDVQKIIASDPALRISRRPKKDFIIWVSTTEPRFVASASQALDDDHVAWIQFLPNDKSKVGDAIALWGTPTHQDVFLCGGADSNRSEFKIYFKGNIRILAWGLGVFDVAGVPEQREIRLSPDDRVQIILFFSPLDFPKDGNNRRTWEGFRGWKRDEIGFGNSCGR
jgi:hypothetical protein